MALAAGLPIAYLFATYRFPGKGILRAAFTAPFVLPPLVVAIALQDFLGRGGLSDDLMGIDVLRWMGPFNAIVLAHVFYNLSLVVRIVGDQWARIPPELSEAARTLGAGRAGSVLRVLLPIAFPSVLAASGLVFLFTLTSFGIILLLAGPGQGTLETLIYGETNTFLPNYAMAATLGLLQLALVALTLLAYLWAHDRSRSTFLPHANRIRRPLPGPALPILFLGILGLVGPLLALTGAAFTDASGFTLRGLRLLLTGGTPFGSYTAVEAIINSVRFGLLTAVLAVPMAVAAMYAVRAARAGRRWMEILFLSPLGVSSVLLGLGVLLAYDGQTLWDLRAHPGRIVAAHAVIAFPFITRILAPAIDALEPRLLEAGRTLGATRAKAFWRVELPLLRPALATAAVFAFAASLGEFGATLTLRRPEFTTVPLAIYDAFGRPGPDFRAQAEVLCVLLVLVAAASFWLLDRLPAREVRGLV